jgi:hypothetical protein
MNDTDLPATHSLQSLLGALAVITREVAEHLETTSSGIGQELMKTGSCSSDVMVRLQDFDRMRQQLTAVGDVLEHCNSLILHAAPHNVDAIVASVSMRQMRHRIQAALDQGRPTAVAEPEIEQVF